MLHPEMQALFDEHQKPTYCDPTKVANAALPIVDFVTMCQMQVAQYRQLLVRARRADHDGELDGKIDRLRQKLTRLDAPLSQALELFELVSDAFTEFHTVVGEDGKLLNEWSARKVAAAKTPVAATPVAVK